MFAQLGFCQGNSGDPIFLETFGTGLTDSPLPAGTTTYTYANGQAPEDGLYTVSSNSNYFDWFDIDDHTPNDNNGRMLIVNSDFTAGEFYRTNINGLCENTTYEFSSWLINLTPSTGFCGNSQIPINVRFEIWDNTDTNLLASGNTGDIFGSNSPNWDQYALVFQTAPSQTSVILKMLNNGSGGCGNDLAIDDITFKSCGDSIAVADTSNNNSVTVCSTQVPYSETITAMPDNAVFSNHFYQWQISTDGTNWTDINGETGASLNINNVTTSAFYRAKVAEFQGNLDNSDCITFSDIFQVIINQAPAQPNLECWETATFNDNTCSWEISGTQPPQPTNLECWEVTFFNDATCSWEVSGMQPEAPTDLLCWQSTTFNNETCQWEITGTQPIESRDVFINLCQDEIIELEVESDIVNPEYMWNSGEETESINVNSAGVYVVEVTNGCLTEIITFTVNEIIPPVIETIESDGSSIIVNLLTEGDYQYSVDGVNFQSCNVFNNQPSRLYTVFVRSIECDFEVSQEHLHFFIPKFMTPNNDGVNDFFSINALEFFPSSKVFIFDRYGKLLFSAINRNINWDGTFNSEDLPTSDYWYLIEIGGQQLRGHFALKR